MPLFLLTAFNWFRTSWIGRGLAVAGVLLMGVWLIYGAGKREARKDQEFENLREHHRLGQLAATTAKRARTDAIGLSRDELAGRLRAKGAIRDNGDL